MLEAMKPISKAIGGFVAGAVIAWATTKGLALPADVADAFRMGVEAAAYGLLGTVIVYFFPANK